MSKILLVVYSYTGTCLGASALPPGMDEAAVPEALKGGKALGAASYMMRFRH
jgi:hypothetical protein